MNHWQRYQRFSLLFFSKIFIFPFFLQFRINGHAYTVWDVGGQDKLRPLWRSYTRCTDGIIFVVDSTKEDRMEEAKLELLKICKNGNNKSIPILILANKQDLPSALDVCKIEAALGLKKEFSGAQWHLQPTCAVTGEGLDEGMEKLQSMILQKKKLRKATSGMMITPQNTKSLKTSRKVQRSHSHHVLSRSWIGKLQIRRICDFFDSTTSVILSEFKKYLSCCISVINKIQLWFFRIKT